MWGDRTLDMHVVAIGSFWTKAKHVICTNILRATWIMVGIHAVVISQLAKSAMIVRARFVFFRRDAFVRLRMSVDAALFFMTVTILRNEFAYWHLVFLISMEKVALCSIFAHALTIENRSVKNVIMIVTNIIIVRHT